MRRRSRQFLLACMQLLLCVDVCVSNTRRQPCSQDMGLEQLLQRARDLESVERSAAAAECLTLATRREPKRADVWMLLTELLQRSGQGPQALDVLTRALREVPGGDRSGRVRLATAQAAALEAYGRHDQAREGYQLATRLLPDSYMTWYNLGYHEMTQYAFEGAREAFLRAAELNPGFGRAAEAVGAVYFGNGQEEESIPWFEKAVVLMPNEVGTRMNLANALGKLERAEEARDAYAGVLSLDPAHADAACKLAYFSLQICDWRDYNAYTRRVLAIVRQDQAARRTSQLIPFNGLMMPVTIHDQRYLAESHAARHAGIAPLPALPPLPVPPRGKTTQEKARAVRVGYLSADFRNHPMGRELSVLLPQHTHARRRVVCYAQNPPHAQHDGPYRRKFVDGTEGLREINALSDAAAAALIRSDDIDVLVDLMGYTHGARDGVVAMRPARMHISFKGYMSTMGSPYHDALIADAAAVPVDLAGFYSEALLYVSPVFSYIYI